MIHRAYVSYLSQLGEQGVQQAMLLTRQRYDQLSQDGDPNRWRYAPDLYATYQARGMTAEELAFQTEVAGVIDLPGLLTADGRKLLLMHGDQFDRDVCLGRWHAWLGDKAYVWLMFANRWYNRYRRARGHGYWSLAGYIKSRVAGARFLDFGLDESFKNCVNGLILLDTQQLLPHKKKRYLAGE